MRRLLIAGNWKMHGTLSYAQTLAKAIVAKAATYSNIDILILPTFLQLSMVSLSLDQRSVLLGAQNLYINREGAYTGEISGMMLADVGCQYVLIGHSERRTLFHESNDLVAAKFLAAKEVGLIPILCVGETQEERAAGQTEAVIRDQLIAVIEANGVEAFDQAVIAYEPVWAIGSGLTAEPRDAQLVHAFIRGIISQYQTQHQNKVDLSNTIRILYGGSMKPNNASILLAMPDIDGGLIGGASLEAKSFLEICEAANSLKKEASTH